MKEKILKAIKECLLENGYSDIKILEIFSGTKEEENEIVANVKIRAHK